MLSKPAKRVTFQHAREARFLDNRRTASSVKPEAWTQPHMPSVQDATVSALSHGTLKPQPDVAAAERVTCFGGRNATS